MKVFLGIQGHALKWLSYLNSLMNVEYLSNRDECDLFLHIIAPNSFVTESLQSVLKDCEEHSNKVVLVVINQFEDKSFSKFKLHLLVKMAEHLREYGVTVFYDLKTAALHITNRKNKIDTN